MAQPPLHLIIGNYNTSSWSLRAWLALRLARLAFVETRIPLRTAESPGRIAAVSPSGKLPVLLAEGVPIWDSLAIAEFVAELEPGIWPLDPIARAEARAISAEMHSGFADLRRLMPMDVVSRFSPPGRLPRGLAADIARMKAIWSQCRARFAPQGPFLFGAFSIADCMMAPVATRFVTHGVPVEGVVEDYVDSVMSWPDIVTWCDAASAEQAEREATGELGVAELTRPGRVLGRDAEAAPPPDGAPSAAGPLPRRPDGEGEPASGAIPPPPVSVPPPAPPPATTAPGTGTPAAKTPAIGAPAIGATTAETPFSEAPIAPGPLPDKAAAMPPAAADDAATRGTAAGPEAPPEASAAEPAPPPVPTPPATTAALSEASPTTTGSDEASASPAEAPRRRLFEPAPTVSPMAPQAAAPAPAVVPRPDASPADQGPAEPSGTAAGEAPERGAAGPRLGWIRRPVPSEATPEPDEPLAAPLQRRPSFADDDPRPRTAAAPEDDGPEGGAPPRRPLPGRPAGPAVKPIGGGILRRR